MTTMVNISPGLGKDRRLEILARVVPTGRPDSDHNRAAGQSNQSTRRLLGEIKTKMDKFSRCNKDLSIATLPASSSRFGIKAVHFMQVMPCTERNVRPISC